jgi:transposase
VKQERREHGKTAPLTTRRRTPKWKALEPEIRQACELQPDLTLRELQQRLGTTLSVQTLCRALQKMKLTFKKKS